MAWPNVTSLAGGYSRPRAPEQSRVPVTAALTLMPGPARSYPGAVYVDTRTGLPSFGTVKAGMPIRHRLVSVPLDRATVGPGYLKVCYDTKQVKDARSSGTDGELPAAGEEAIFKHYGLTYEPGADGERRLACR